jgi:hypothetical protein
MWTQSGVSRDEIEITLVKKERGVYITSGWTDTKGLAVSNFPAQFKIGLIDNWAIVFGAVENLTNRDLTQKLVYITAPWDVTAQGYHSPWNLALPALAAPADDQWQGNQVYFNPPLCAAMSPTFTETTRYKEIQSMLKFGRDSGLPLQLTFASVIRDNVSGPITYSIDWEGCDSSEAWLRAKFQQATEADRLCPVPALSLADGS